MLVFGCDTLPVCVLSVAGLQTVLVGSEEVAGEQGSWPLLVGQTESAAAELDSLTLPLEIKKTNEWRNDDTMLIYEAQVHTGMHPRFIFYSDEIMPNSNNSSFCKLQYQEKCKGPLPMLNNSHERDHKGFSLALFLLSVAFLKFLNHYVPRVFLDIEIHIIVLVMCS